MIAEEVVGGLGSEQRHGLGCQEASARLKRYGPNELETEKPVPAWQRFLAQFQDVLIILLLVATAISVGLWVYERDTALPYEGLTIFAIVLLNGILGYVQEARAERAVAALRAMSANEATVLRDGERQSVPAAELVPGDVVLIEEGDTIPADARLIGSTALQTMEASLTGESVPVSKDVSPVEEEVGLGDRRNMVFSGAASTYGRGKAVVSATGMHTELGNIAGLLSRTEEQTTPLQKELDRVGKLLGGIVIIIAVVVVVTIVLVEGIRDPAAILDVLIFGVALAVAAVPEGLPAIVTTTLALGVRRMARRNAIVRKLPAVETLGSATVIASDKTGTLTKNEMTVRTVVTASGRVDITGTGYAPEGVLRHEGKPLQEPALRTEVERTLIGADRANNAVLQERDGRWSVQGDPTEGALIVAARKAGLSADALGSRFERVGEVPFARSTYLLATLIGQGARLPTDVLVRTAAHQHVGCALGKHDQALRLIGVFVDRAHELALGGERHLPHPLKARAECLGRESGLARRNDQGAFRRISLHAPAAVALLQDRVVRPVGGYQGPLDLRTQRRFLQGFPLVPEPALRCVSGPGNVYPAARRNDCADRHLVLGQGAGLVGGDHGRGA